MREVAIQAKGIGFSGDFVRPESMARLSRVTVQALRDAVRLKTVRTSRLRGRPFRFLSRIWDIEQGPWGAMGDGSTLLRFRAPSLGESAAELFEQGVLFEEDRLDEDWTAFDLLGQVVESVQLGSALDLRLDYGMLASLASFGPMADEGLEVAFGFQALSGGRAVINSGLAHRAGEALSSTAPRRMVRIVGHLDMLRLSDHVFQLILGDGGRLRGAWTGVGSPLRALLGDDVLIEGLASFRPDGTMMAIEGLAARRAESADEPFRSPPRAPKSHFEVQTAAREPGDWERFVGQWPGEESIEELNALLEEIS